MDTAHDWTAIERAARRRWWRTEYEALGAKHLAELQVWVAELATESVTKTRRLQIADAIFDILSDVESWNDTKRKARAEAARERAEAV